MAKTRFFLNRARPPRRLWDIWPNYLMASHVHVKAIHVFIPLLFNTKIKRKKHASIIMLFLFIYIFSHLCLHPFSLSFSLSFILSFINSLIHSFIYSFVYRQYAVQNNSIVESMHYK